MFNVYNWYRFSRMLYLWGIPVLPVLFKYLIRLVFGCHIPFTADIGKGTVIGYGGIGIVIHDRCIIGENCVIGSCTTLGGTNHKYNVPELGNNVLVGTGAKIIGPVKIGNNVVIGANAVVVTDVPDNTVVTGVPARVIKENINIRDYI